MTRRSRNTLTLFAVGLVGACSADLDGPAPTVASLEPALVCNDQIVTEVVVHGQGMSPLPVDVLGAPRVDLPELALTLVADLRGAPAGAGTPVAIPDDTEPPRVRWTSRQRMAFDVYAELGLAAGVHSLAVTNRNGNGFVLDRALTAVPPPSVSSVGPDIVCVAGGPRTLVLDGEGFLQVGGTLPTVTATPAGGGDAVTFDAAALEDCFDVAGPASGVRSCRRLTFTVPDDGLAVTGDYVNYEIVVTNPAPAGCESADPVLLTVVPPPVVRTVEPPVICNADHDSTITLTGDGFLRIDGAVPQVTVGTTTLAADSLGACTPVTGPAEAVESCDSLTFTIPAGTLAPGIHEVGVTNPVPAGCSASATATLVVVPPPETDSITPDLACVAQDGETFTIAGSGFIRSGSAMPTVSVDGTTFPAETVDGCAPVPGAPAGTDTCASLAFSIPAGGLAPGTYEVVVANPSPVGCVSAGGLVLVIVGPPEVTAIEPPIACLATLPAELTLVGSGFLVVDGAYPTVTIDGAPVVPTAAGGCTDLPAIGVAARTCTSLTVPFPPSAGALGSHVIRVVNPPPADCAAADVTFDVALPPEVTGVVPARVCSVDFTVAVAGSNFMPGTQVRIGATPASSTSYVSGSEMRASFPPMPAGTYDLVVSNGAGCEDTLPGAVTVVENPVVFFVDPPVVYNGINLQVTIYASGVVGAVTAVTIAPSGGGAPIALVFAFDPARPNRILATVPSGAAPGTYDVSVTTELGCSATLVGGLNVTATLTLALEAIDPPFGWTGGSTPVLLTAIDPPPGGMVQFASTPRAYLNPTVPGSLAMPLRSVTFVDATQLNAVVPSGMAVGGYDVVVVNPDGAVGLLAGGFSVGADRPPVIDEVTPASVVNTGTQALTAIGADFRTPAVTLDCEDSAGARSTVTGTVTGSTATTVNFTIPAGGLAAGTVCIVRVTNGDGTYADYSAVSVTNPAANLQPFAAGTRMTAARRAPGSVAGRATRISRFVYAIGGDAGTAAGAFDTVEAAAVDIFGGMGPWREMSYRLPGARTLAGAAILGRYVYLVGGNDGAGPTAQVLRGRILDPEETPEPTDLDMRRGGGAGLAGGTWHYTVSALRPATDPDNPGGETLPSDPLVVLVPNVPERIHLTVSWTGLVGATAYRIYRSPVANDPAGSELLLAEVPAAGPLSYADTGGAVGAQRPLRLGDTGRWAVQPALTVAREALGVAIAADPATPGTFHLYAVGGRNTGGALRTYERATITVAADRRQTLGVWAEDAANRLAVGRSHLMTFAVDRGKASRVPAGTTYLYAAAGVDTGGATVRNTDAALVQAGGTLGPWTALDLMTPARAGYGAAAANNRLYVFGGAGAAPSSNTASAEICGTGVPGCAGGPPELVNWNALGINLTVDRYLMGSAVESAFIFLVGGQSAGGVPTATTEVTVW